MATLLEVVVWFVRMHLMLRIKWIDAVESYFPSLGSIGTNECFFDYVILLKGLAGLRFSF